MGRVAAWRIGNLKDHFAGTREAHAVAGDFFDGGRIRFKAVDALLKFLVFLVELLDLRLDGLNLNPGAAHGDEAVGAEDVLEQQQEKCERKEVARVATKERLRFVVNLPAGIGVNLGIQAVTHLQVVIHLRASSAICFDLSGVSASA